MKKSPYHQAKFLLSAVDVKQLPPDQGLEVALVGRSNAGKSSVLNCLTQNKSLARVSKTPGRTQAINIFTLDDTRRIMDLPGYGFAKVPLAAKRKWEKTIDTYIEKRTCLQGLVLIMDIRHPFKPLDYELLTYCDYRSLPVHLVLNKADKLSQQAVNKTLQETKRVLTAFSNSVTFQVFSALKGKGTEELQHLLDQWYQYT